MSQHLTPQALTGSPFLQVDVLEEGEAVRVGPRGDLDLSNAEELRAVLVAQRVPGRQVLLDLSGLDFMDSTGIQVLLEADAAARENGHTLTVGNLSPAVRRALEITGVLGRLPIAESPAGVPTMARSARAAWCPR